MDNIKKLKNLEIRSVTCQRTCNVLVNPLVNNGITEIFIYEMCYNFVLINVMKKHI